MYDREAFETVASEIAEWEIAAQQLPLPELYRDGGHLPERPGRRA